MIQIAERELPSDASASLADYQSEVAGAGDYAAQVERGKLLFERRNRKDNATFRAVRATLDSMCSGSRRCICETPSYSSRSTPPARQSASALTIRSSCST